MTNAVFQQKNDVPPHLDAYAVIGNPIAHSKSPLIHQAFALQTAQALHYGTLLADLDYQAPTGFEATLQQFFSEGGKGLNVTVPFKERASVICAHLTPRAQAAGAVNTLWQYKGELYGDNTDGAGLVRDITQNLGFSLAGKRILLLGAGGAARGVILPLAQQAPEQVVLWNRTLSKAHAIVAALPLLPNVRVWQPQDADAAFDVVINATSASLHGATLEVPLAVFLHAELAYDMMYGAQPTAFMRIVQQAGAARVADGLGMLVEQAAEAFCVWRGVMPQTAPVLQAVRAGLVA